MKNGDRKKTIEYLIVKLDDNDLTTHTQTDKLQETQTKWKHTAYQMVFRSITLQLKISQVIVHDLHMHYKGKILKIFRLRKKRRRLKQLMNWSRRHQRYFPWDNWSAKEQKQLSLSLYWLTIFNLCLLINFLSLW